MHPSAGTGRQDKLKIYWLHSWGFKSLLGYIVQTIQCFQYTLKYITINFKKAFIAQR